MEKPIGQKTAILLKRGFISFVYFWYCSFLVYTLVRSFSLSLSRFLSVNIRSFQKQGRHLINRLASPKLYIFPFRQRENGKLSITGKFEVNRMFFGLFASLYRWQNVLQKNESQLSPRYPYHDDIFCFFQEKYNGKLNEHLSFSLVCLVFNRVRPKTCASRSLTF